MKKLNFKKLDFIEWLAIVTVAVMIILTTLLTNFDGGPQPSLFEEAGRAAHSVVKDFKIGYDKADSAANKHGR